MEFVTYSIARMVPRCSVLNVNFLNVRFRFTSRRDLSQITTTVDEVIPFLSFLFDYFIFVSSLAFFFLSKKYRRLLPRETLITQLISDKDKVLKLAKVVNLICSNIQLTEKTLVRTIKLLKCAVQILLLVKAYLRLPLFFVLFVCCLFFCLFFCVTRDYQEEKGILHTVKTSKIQGKSQNDIRSVVCS